jgi:hypothetical protein
MWRRKAQIPAGQMALDFFLVDVAVPANHHGDHAFVGQEQQGLAGCA